MKLRDCQKDLAAVMMRESPFRERASESWQQALRRKAVPESLFRFYVNASYFAPDKAPPFLADSGRVLFSYLGTVVECIRESLEESRELEQVITDLEGVMYNPIKKVRGEIWDRGANQRSRRALRNLLLNLSSVLDLTAEVFALFFPGTIRRLKLGQAHFAALKAWLLRPFPAEVIPILSARRHHTQRFHEALAPLIPTEGSKGDWLPLFGLYRNKLTHFGALSFTDYRLHDDAGDFYAFLPRNWPFIWQQYLSWEADHRQRSSLWETIEKTCIHIDLIEFINGARKRVFRIVDSAFLSFLETYDGLKSLEVNSAALEDLNRSMRVESFVDFER